MHVSTYSFENSSNHYRNATKGNTKVRAVCHDLFPTQKHPFLFLGQFQQAKELVIMPLKSLSQLAEEAGDPGREFIIKSNRIGTFDTAMLHLQDIDRMTFLNMSLRCG